MEERAHAIAEIPGASEEALRACTAHDRIYQVLWTASRDRYEVHADDGGLLGFSRDRHAAVEAALREATHAYGEGFSVLVCVEQDDGGFAVEWEAGR